MKYNRTKKIFSRLFNFRFWSDFGRVNSAYHNIVDSIHLMFVTPTKQQRVQSEEFSDEKNKFQESVKKYNLTPDNLLSMQKSLLSWVYCMLTFALLSIIYFFYHLTQLNLHSALLISVGAGIFLVLAFRYHYFYFQIKTKQLGCSLSVWFKEGLLGKSK